MKLACYMGHHIELQLKSCALAKSINNVPVSSLSFWETKCLIKEGRFNVKLILPIIYKQVHSMMMTPHLDNHIHLETSSDDDEAPARTPCTANK
jgi:PIN domain nuclease of toxin-antitoxin system